MNPHQELERRSLALHRLVAAKIRQEPALLQAAAATLARWRATGSPHAWPYLDAWRDLIAKGLEPCLAFATEESERATAMRQSSPFSGVLTPRERWRFLAEWKAGHAP